MYLTKPFPTSFVLAPFIYMSSVTETLTVTVTLTPTVLEYVETPKYTIKRSQKYYSQLDLG